MSLWSLYQGCGDSWTVPVRDSNGNALSYTGTETLGGSVWTGGMEAELFSLAPVWTTPSTGLTRVAISGTSIATLTPGLYTVRLTVLDGGEIKPYYVGRLQILPSPDSVTAPTVDLITPAFALDIL